MENRFQDENSNSPVLMKIKLGYIFHLFLQCGIIIFNLLSYYILIWGRTLFGYFFLIVLFAYLMFLFLPAIVVVLIFICCTVNISLDSLKKSTFVSTSVLFIVGTILCFLLWLNILLFNDFYENCPYSFYSSEIQRFFGYENDNSTENIKKCEYKRCLYEDTSKSETLSYQYLCNFDSSKDFGKKNDGSQKYETKDENGNKKIIYHLIKCELVNKKDDYQYSIINKYFNVCPLFKDFYLCKRLYEATTYEVKYNFKCPGPGFYLKLYIFGILSIVTNIFLPIILLFTDIIMYRKLTQYLQSIQVRLNNSNQLQTANSSKKHESCNGENSNNFKKEVTEIIIVENKNDEINGNLNDNAQNLIINTTKKPSDNNIKCSENSVENKDKENNEKDFGDEIMENNIICLKLRSNKNEKENNSRKKNLIEFSKNFTRKVLKDTSINENQRDQSGSKDLFNIDTNKNERKMSDVNQ